MRKHSNKPFKFPRLFPRARLARAIVNDIKIVEHVTADVLDDLPGFDSEAHARTVNATVPALVQFQLERMRRTS